MGAYTRLRPQSSTARQIELGIFIVILVMIGLRVWFQPPSALEQLTFRGELQAVLVERPLGRSELFPAAGRDQLDLALLHGFAEELGVRLQLTRVDDAATAHRLLRERRVDLAAGLLVDPRDPRIERGPQILSVQHALVYWRGNERGTALSSLFEVPAGARIGVTAQAPVPEALAQPFAGEIIHAGEDPGPNPGDAAADDADPFSGEGHSAAPVPPEIVSYSNASALRRALEAGEIDFALMNSLEHRRLRRMHPQLRTAYEPERAGEVTWLFPSGFDRSLINAAGDYIERLRANRELDLMVDRYLGHLEIHNLFETIAFGRHIDERLDRFRDLFEEAGDRHDLDWRFIAAVAYQESHWDPDAVSPTGVRGLMMLTRATASDLGIRDRTDPAASIDGGARYLAQLHERLPETIPEPDRTWMTLAAYNVGLGHVYDARRLAEANGDDPDRWMDVMQWLPRLAEREWYQRTRFGYARGWEPVHYVQNIRSYYDKLMQRFPKPEDREPEPPRIYRNTPLTL